MALGYLYTFNAQEGEQELLRMEMRALFGEDGDVGIIRSERDIDVSRSPFVKERVDVLCSGDSVADIAAQVPDIDLGGKTFLVRFLKRNDLSLRDKIEYAEQRAIERRIADGMRGIANVREPDVTYAIVPFGGRWFFGVHARNNAKWLDHQRKPSDYSIALPTRLARAAVNIAAPDEDPAARSVIDPCCGIGTVLVEAASIGMRIVGRDVNPLATTGARANLVHFGYACEVALGDIADVTAHYDSAILDLPYNHVTKITPASQLALIRHARRIADRAVVVSIAPIDGMLAEAGFEIVDRCVWSKNDAFERHIIVCE
ncbi:TRM11 family SAM-dependent methyltransferase [Cohnella sp. GCM10027633]|uniref:TRM11 family SAM-dependent methyltransferase n=1 Tax=unclassified Cohnella TaxID=2636738 RepID=UPI003639FD2F